MHSVLVCLAVLGVSILGSSMNLPGVDFKDFAVSAVPEVYGSSLRGAEVKSQAMGGDSGYGMLGMYASKKCDGNPVRAQFTAFGVCVPHDHKKQWKKFSAAFTGDWMHITEQTFNEATCAGAPMETHVSPFPTKCTKNDQFKGFYVVARRFNTYQEIPQPHNGLVDL
jgi:hypothetical protein